MRRIFVTALVATFFILGPGIAQADIAQPGSANFDAAHGSWQTGALGTPVNLNYSYSNLLDGGIVGRTTAQLRSDVEQSLNIIVAFVPINFTEVADAGPAPTPADTPYGIPTTTPELRFGRHALGGTTLAHAFFPNGGSGLVGDVHMDDESQNWSGDGFFLEVFLHEVGHALGLGHEDVEMSLPVPSAFNANPLNPTTLDLPIMCATCFHQGSPGFADGGYLYQDDVDGLRSLYGTGVGSVTPIPEPSAVLLVGLVVLGCGSKRRRFAS